MAGSSGTLVGEVKKLLQDEETATSGVSQFVSYCQSADETDHEGFLHCYCVASPQCTELLSFLDAGKRQRTSQELRLGFTALENILLHTATVSPTAVAGGSAVRSVGQRLVTKLLQQHMKLVYHALNTSAPAELTCSCLRLLAAMVTQGSSAAHQLLAVLDLGYKPLQALAGRRDRKAKQDVRMTFVRFCAALLLYGDAEVHKTALESRALLSSLFKHLPDDRTVSVYLLLSVINDKVLESKIVSKNTKVLFFSSYALGQLAKLCTRYDDIIDVDDGQSASIGQLAMKTLEKVCCSTATGIAFSSKLSSSQRGNNPVLLQFLIGLQSANVDEQLRGLVVNTLSCCPDILHSYWTAMPFSIEPRATGRWVSTMQLLLAILSEQDCPPAALLSSKHTSNSSKDDTVAEESSSEVDLLTTLFNAVLPTVVPSTLTQLVFSHGLQHQNWYIKLLTLRLLAMILHRSNVIILHCSASASLPGRKHVMSALTETVVKLLPNINVLMALRQQLTNHVVQGKEADDKALELDDIESVGTDVPLPTSELLLSLTLEVMAGYQYLLPMCFVEISYDLCKLLYVSAKPVDSDEAATGFGHLPSRVQLQTIRLLSQSPAQSLQWLKSGKGRAWSPFRILLYLVLTSSDVKVVAAVQHLLSMWLHQCHAFSKEEALMCLRCLKQAVCVCEEVVDVEAVVSAVAFFDSVMCQVVEEPHFAVLQWKQFVGKNELGDKMAAESDRSIDSILTSESLDTPLRGGCDGDASALQRTELPLSPGLVAIIHSYGQQSRKALQSDLNPGKATRLEDLSLFLGYVCLECLPRVSNVPDFTRFVVACFSIPGNSDWQASSDVTALSSWKAQHQAVMSFVQWWLPDQQCGLCATSSHLPMTLSSLSDFLSPVQVLLWEAAAGRDTDVRKEHSCRKKRRLVDRCQSCVNVRLVETLNSSVWRDGVLKALHDADSGSSPAVARHLFLIIKTLLCCSSEVGTVDALSATNFCFELLRCLLSQCYELHDTSLQTWEDLCDAVFMHPVVIASTLLNSGDVFGESDELALCVRTHCLALISSASLDEGQLSTLCDRLVQSVVDDLSSRQGCLPEMADALIATITHLSVEHIHSLLTVLSSCTAECFVSDGGNVDSPGQAKKKKRPETAQSVALSAAGRLLMCLLGDSKEMQEIVRSPFPVEKLSFPFPENTVAALIRSEDAVRISIAAQLVHGHHEHGHYFAKLCCGDGKDGNLFSGQKKKALLLPIVLAFLPLSNNTSVRASAEGLMWEAECLLYHYYWQWLCEQLTQSETSCVSITMVVEIMLHFMKNGHCESEEDVFEQVCSFPSLGTCWSSDHIRLLCGILDQIVSHATGRQTASFVVIFLTNCIRALQICYQQPGQAQGDVEVHLLKAGLERAMFLKKKKHWDASDLLSAWPSFVKQALRLRFGCSGTMCLLSELTDLIYGLLRKKGGSKLRVQLDGAKPALESLHELLMSHSQFLPTLLGELDQGTVREEAGCSSAVKDGLLQLLLAIVSCGSTVCQPHHLPAFLAAYQPLLDSANQKLLCIIHQYEEREVSLAHVRPLLWGKAAMEQLQMSMSGNRPRSLWGHAGLDEVLQLLNRQRLQHTVVNFPLDLPLKPLLSDFRPPAEKVLYDPRFLLPCFAHLLEAGHVVDCRRFVDGHGLGLALAALASEHPCMRSVGYLVLQLFKDQLEGAYAFRERQQLIVLLGNLRRAITTPGQQLPFLIVLFLARAASILLHPGHWLYPFINQFLLQRPILSVDDVPLFYSLFNSSSLQFKRDRSWMLQLLIDGLRGLSDYQLYHRRHVLELSMSLYLSSTCDARTQSQVSQLVCRACSLPSIAHLVKQLHAVEAWHIATAQTLGS